MILAQIFFRICYSYFSSFFMIVSLEIEPRFPRHRAAPVSSKIPPWKSVPNLERARGGDRASDLLLTSLGLHQLGQIRVASPPIQEHLLHSHRLLPQSSRPNPNSKIQTCRLDFGFWILDLGFWILDFGSWILDFAFCERFGFCIRLLLLHADSGRRIHPCFWTNIWRCPR